jgi:hypothetical protein
VFILLNLMSLMIMHHACKHANKTKGSMHQLCCMQGPDCKDVPLYIISRMPLTLNTSLECMVSRKQGLLLCHPANPKRMSLGCEYKGTGTASMLPSTVVYTL